MKIHYLKTIVLKELFEENWQDYKVRIVSNSCDFYLDDMEKTVRRINDSNGRCRAIHYYGQTKKELLKELFRFLSKNWLLLNRSSGYWSGFFIVSYADCD